MVSASRMAIAGAIISTRRWRSTQRSQADPNSARAEMVSGTCGAMSVLQYPLGDDSALPAPAHSGAAALGSGARRPLSLRLADGPGLFETGDLFDRSLGVLQGLLRRDRPGDRLRQLDAERVLDFRPLRMTRTRRGEFDRRHQCREVAALLLR